VLATTTAYGEVRHYDIRASNKIISNAQITKEQMQLTHVLQSKINEHILYVMSQEGHLIQLDRRFNCRMIRKMPGAKGSVRDV